MVLCITIGFNQINLACILLAKAFTPILKNLQNFEINHLGTKMTNVNIWVLVSFSHNLFNFKKILVKWFTNGFKVTLENLEKLKFVCLVPRIQILTFG